MSAIARLIVPVSKFPSLPILNSKFFILNPNFSLLQPSNQKYDRNPYSKPQGKLSVQCAEFSSRVGFELALFFVPVDLAFIVVRIEADRLLTSASKVSVSRSYFWIWICWSFVLGGLMDWIIKPRPVNPINSQNPNMEIFQFHFQYRMYIFQSVSLFLVQDKRVESL